MEEFTRKYQPDRGFMKKLKKLDKNLDCFFSENIDLLVITYKRATGHPVPIMTIQNDNNNFRLPDDRDIDKLKESDTHRIPMDERLKRATQYMWNFRKDYDKQSKEEIRNRTKDDKIWLYNKFSRLAGTGKGNSAFRRITPKLRGIAY